MGTTPLPSTPELPRLAFDRRVCVAANRWGTRRAVGVFFGTVSRLGDGVFWYALMLALVVFDGWRGLQAAAHMAATGLTALLLYRLLKRHTRRPRPFRRRQLTLRSRNSLCRCTARTGGMTLGRRKQNKHSR